MIVKGAKITDSETRELYRGPLDECLAFCRKENPVVFDALDVYRNDGTLYKKIVRYGKPVR